MSLYQDSPLADYVHQLTPYAFSAVKKQYELSLNITIPEGSIRIIQMERSDGLINISTTHCDCRFFRSMLLPCRHIFALLAFYGLDLFISNSCAKRWTKSYYKQHRVFIEPVQEHHVEVDISAAPKSIKTPTQHEKYKVAFEQAQKLASICSELPLRQYFPSLNVLKQLASAWQEGKHVTIHILNTSEPSALHIPIGTSRPPLPKSSQSFSTVTFPIGTCSRPTLPNHLSLYLFQLLLLLQGYHFQKHLSLLQLCLFQLLLFLQGCMSFFVLLLRSRFQSWFNCCFSRINRKK